jgi:signal peptidase II
MQIKTELKLTIMRIYEYIPVKCIFIFSFLVFIDQLSKYLIRLKGGFYICNPDISWGIKVNSYALIIFWTILILILLAALKSKYFVNNPLYITLILAGAVSNMLDRIYFGCVVDFINLKFWPIFNLADFFIVCGALFLLVRRRKI